jgi:hypothetical protein
MEGNLDNLEIWIWTAKNLDWLAGHPIQIFGKKSKSWP